MKIQIVSNRLPVKINKHNDQLDISMSSGGLATGLSSLLGSDQIRWTGWAGLITSNPRVKRRAEELLNKKNLIPVWLSGANYRHYYEGFSNQVIWPLFHYFSQHTTYREEFWQSYVEVNQLFCDKLMETATENDIFWIHDYHLMLLPGMIRKRFPNARIGFFLHIPFPHHETFRHLPWRKEILEGLCGADLIGFHTPEYGAYFLDAIETLLDVKVNANSFYFDQRQVKVKDLPMGIDYKKFAAQARKEEVLEKVTELKKEYDGKELIVSVDRLDYTKGIIQRLRAFDHFLGEHPEYREKICLLELIVPSRAEVKNYRTLKGMIDKYSGKINGKYSTPFWTPVRYLYRAVDLDTLSAFYLSADIALITPLRDGMNLVAKEYVALHQQGKGALILSEFAGAALQLTNALIVNPNDIYEISKAIKKALNMSESEKKERLRRMQQILSETNVNKWAEAFISELENCNLFPIKQWTSMNGYAVDDLASTQASAKS